jgi:fatty-acid desaturase
MWTINLETVGLSIIATIAWIVGGYELWQLFFVDYSWTSWVWLLAALIYCAVIHELFFHLVVGHKLINYQPQRIFFKILVFLTTVSSSLGSIRAMALYSDSHHDFADQGKLDYINSRYTWYTTGFITPLMYLYSVIGVTHAESKSFLERQKQRHHDLLNDEWTIFCDENRVILTVITWTLLYFLFPFLLFKIILVSRLIITIINGIVTTVGHTNSLFGIKSIVGYRNFNSPDQTRNLLILHFLCLTLIPSILHNNHHGKPIEQSHQHCWFEFDLGSIILHRLLKPVIT